MGKTVLRAEHLKAFYVLDAFGTRKVIQAVDGVDLEARENEVYGIAGESGCGKTTLLKVLYGAVEPPLRLMGGKVCYCLNGEELDASSLDAEALRRLRWEYISYVPQGSMSVLNPVIKVKETFADYLESHVKAGSRDEVLRIAKEHLSALGLPLTVLECYPHQLSGGMRQRVTIALATLLKPRVIITDEPTTALDVVIQRGVIQLLKDIQRALGNTIILVTHDMGVHASISDRIGIMYAGRMIEEATAEEIFKNPLHPYTRYLINSLPRFGDKGTRESVPGSPPSLASPPSGCPFHPRCPHTFAPCGDQMPRFVEPLAHHKVACWLIEEG